ncbi:multidrug efflux SMR transporter [Brachybacterium muris]|uniref:DMT family transporter n=1 Tax=Brachybacterium muris TaxID=219301 RepID=UPI0030B8142D
MTDSPSAPQGAPEQPSTPAPPLTPLPPLAPPAPPVPQAASDAPGASGTDRDGSTAITWLLLAGAIVVEMAATLSLKGALTHPWLYVVVVAGYTGAFGLLALVLRRGMGLAVAYGIWGALGVVAAAVLSWVIFDEQLNAVMGAGIVLVVAGVLAIEFGAQQARGAAAASTATTAAASPAPASAGPREGAR